MKNNKQNKYDKFFNKVLNKMFSMVGLQPKEKEEFVKQEDWFLKKEFNKKQCEQFKYFFIKEIKKDLKLNSKQAENEYHWFNLGYGWKDSSSNN